MKRAANNFFRIGFVLVLLLIAAMFALTAAERGVLSPWLVPWLNGLVRVLGPAGAFAAMGAIVAVFISRTFGR